VTCETCHDGEVRPVRVRAFPPAFVALGYACWAVAILGAAGATDYAYVHRVLPAAAAEAGTAAARRAALERLRAIDSVPQAVIGEFERRAEVSDTTLESLGDEMQGEVEMVIADYHVARRHAVETPPPAWYSSRLLLAIYGLSVFLLVAGASLLVRVEVYRCDRCGAPA
jgi:hypothetical protein